MIKSSFRPSELWRPQSNKMYKEWKNFTETKRREMELIMSEETPWQWIVRKVTGDSPLRSKLFKTNNLPTAY